MQNKKLAELNSLSFADKPRLFGCRFLHMYLYIVYVICSPVVYRHVISLASLFPLTRIFIYR